MKCLFILAKIREIKKIVDKPTKKTYYINMVGKPTIRRQKMKSKKEKVMDSLIRINRKLFTVNNYNNDSLIGIGQINILNEIMNHEKITQDELAKVMNLDKTTIAKAVKRLESNGLITRNQCETDRRKKELSVTEKVLNVKEHMTKHMDENRNSIFEGVNEDEMDIFQDVLKKIETNIEIKKNSIREKKQLGKIIMKYIEKNQGVTTTKLAAVLEKEVDEINSIVEKLTIKEFLEENNGILSITKKAEEHKKNNRISN